MHDFVAHVLRRYYTQTEWNPFNSYLYLTNSSQSVLDFAIPHGLSLSISASPSPPFFTNYRLRALPTLTGALGYIFASIEDNDGNPRPLELGGSSRDIRFKELVDHFSIIDSPRRPLGKDQVWQAGRRVDKRDYLLYGCVHIPSARVDALVATRLSPTWQLLATAISMPPRNPLGLSSQSSYASTTEKANTDSVATAPAIAAGPPPGSTNLHFNLQRDTGRWFTEYSYSVDDGLLGFRVLHNLGHIELAENSSGTGVNGSLSPSDQEQNRRQRVDEESGLENAVGGGLQGRFSVGAELFFSPLEKSAGISTGMRFTTLPEASIPAAIAASTLMGQSSLTPSQPPTTITATLNPMMGHLSTAYAAKMTRDIVACSRFDFNVYSYESELTVGAEYWLRSNPLPNTIKEATISTLTSISKTTEKEELISPKVDEGSSNIPDDTTPLTQSALPDTTMNDTVLSSASSALGVLKARISTSGIAALLWEGKMRNCLVSVGIRGDVSSNEAMGGLGSGRPLRAVGIDVIYFSQDGR
ncbi:uncharacterized protein FA14DRAFT_145717 [Meira miltonrushii]|uniref:Mitochondrial distribution and morphology protein 10 n=1 Tax=Meira miltonrushii TaxID=1280837 RepID=A0A316VDW7_9BASI|nr:uncharacterized protein FA14DRAFT_145717 [Meira miltonrushii]PWN35746.1 hypothetical protein FA14DRAFT_145717 [Meira miltonrushii]